MISYIYSKFDTLTNFVEILGKSIVFGKVEMTEHCNQDGYEIMLKWQHGKNQYYVTSLISREDCIKNSRKVVFDKFNDLLEIRDAHVRNVTFWTNCKDVR